MWYVSGTGWITEGGAYSRTSRFGDVVAVVGVAHDDVAAARRLDSANECASVAAPSDSNHTGTGVLGALVRPVSAAVIGDNDPPAIPAVRRAVVAFRTHVSMVSASF